jgi:hypothetical protein
VSENPPIHSSGPGSLCVHICSPGTDREKMVAALAEVGLSPDAVEEGLLRVPLTLLWFHDIADDQWLLVDRAEQLAGGDPPGEYSEVVL